MHKLANLLLKLSPVYNSLTTKSNSRVQFIRVFSFLSWVILVVNLLIFLYYAIRSVLYPLPLDYGEGVVMNLAYLLRTHGNYYFDIHSYPFVHGAYPPIFPWLASLFIDSGPPQFLTGRTISVTAAVLIALVLYSIFRDESPLLNRRYPIFLALTTFIIPFLVYWSPLMRVDTLAIFFSVAGLSLFTYYNKVSSPKIYWAAIFFILAFYTKQNAVAAPLAVSTFLLLKDRKKFVKFIILYLTPVASIFLLINARTNGQFYTHLVTLTKFMPLNISNIPLYYAIFALFSVGFIVTLVLYYRISFQYRLFGLYFVFNLIFLAAIAKHGAGFNYYIEPFISLLIVFGLVFLRVIQTAQNEQLYWLCGIFIFQLLLLFPYQLAIDILQNPIFPAGHRERLQLNQYTQQTPGPILSEDWGYLLINGKEAFYEPFQFSMMSKYNLWDESKIVRRCEDGEFTLVIAGWRIFNSKGLAACLERRYLPIDRVNHYRILRPRSVFQSL